MTFKIYIKIQYILRNDNILIWLDLLKRKPWSIWEETLLLEYFIGKYVIFNCFLKLF